MVTAEPVTVEVVTAFTVTARGHYYTYNVGEVHIGVRTREGSKIYPVSYKVVLNCILQCRNSSYPADPLPLLLGT